MIAILKKDVTEPQIKSLTSWFEKKGLAVHLSKGDTTTIMGLVGDTSAIDTELIEGLDMVEKVTRITEPFKKSNRKFHPQDTVITVSGVNIGDGFTAIAELDPSGGTEMTLKTAEAAKAAGAQILSFGASGAKYAPYTCPHTTDIRDIISAVKGLSLPIAQEIVSVNDITLCDDADIIIIGASNMQNYELLREIGKTDKPVILKRSLAGTLEELLISAEHIMVGGNEKVILCERGIRTFETYTKNTLDLSAVPVLHDISHLPVISDISHAVGLSQLASPMAAAAVACGADGIMLEVKSSEDMGRTDAVTDKEFEEIIKKAIKIKEVI